MNTPWSEASPKAHIPWNSYEDFQGAQVLEPLTITLEKGQDLVVYVNTSENLLNTGWQGIHGNFMSEREIRYNLDTIKYSWNNWPQGADMGFVHPLQPLRSTETSHYNQKVIAYHFEHANQGKAMLTFKYALSGSEHSFLFGESDCQVNVKKIFVTCK